MPTPIASMPMSPALHPALRTGHADIDDDHEALLAEAGDCARCMDDALHTAFVKLQARFEVHFAQEDALMVGVDFSSRDCHLDEHAAVLQSFAQAAQALRDGQCEPARRMAQALVDWLPAHIDALDRQLAKFLFHRKTGGAPVLLHR